MDKYNIGMFIISKAVVEATACFNFFICDRMIGLDMCVDANEMCHNHAPTTTIFAHGTSGPVSHLRLFDQVDIRNC